MNHAKNWFVCAILNGLLAFPMLAAADQPNICLTLTPNASGDSEINLTVYATNKPGSVSTFYGLNGSGSTTQGSDDLFYLVSGTGYVTTKNAIETSLTGTAVDPSNGIREVTFHIVIDGTNDRYTQITRTTASPSEVVVAEGAAAFSEGKCGKKK